ncbi:hypothetical protein L1987_10785 [Smallanthus sonchifolius]|uniref:Uncharacterized protein n=1 Tax=Smallanthus sonchifolius TaxID=185202 RepID=A0ACB9J936_9ASTR|nr:hypothetical protein L1987_10785 [Smallanthus sonchifolius]
MGGGDDGCGAKAMGVVVMLVVAVTTVVVTVVAADGAVPTTVVLVVVAKEGEEVFKTTQSSLSFSLPSSNVATVRRRVTAAGPLLVLLALPFTRSLIAQHFTNNFTSHLPQQTVLTFFPSVTSTSRQSVTRTFKFAVSHGSKMKKTGNLLLLGMVFGYAYPAYECFKSVEKNKPDIEQLRFWCQYWILVAVLTLCERIGDTFISWVPMYSEAKLAFYVYLWYPKTKGTTYVFDSFFQPYISKHETEIDRNLSELRTMAGDMTVLYWQRTAGKELQVMFKQELLILFNMLLHNQHRNLDPLRIVLNYKLKLQPQKPAKPHQPASHNKGQTAAQQEARVPQSPAASSASSSNSGSDEIDHKSDAGKPQVLPMPVVKAQKANTTRNLAVTTEIQTTTEPERKLIEPAGSSSSDVNPSTTPKEIMMEEEPVRVTRARLRKGSSLQ